MTVNFPTNRLLGLCVAAIFCLCLAGCGAQGGPSRAERVYFENYSNETRNSIAWWKRQADTVQLIRLAQSFATPAKSAADQAAKRDEALETLRNEYGLNPQEVQAVVNGQINRTIEEQLVRGRRKLEVRIERLQQIYTQTCKDFERNPKGTVDELKRAENDLEKYLK
jgi:hypothetical protein